MEKTIMLTIFLTCKKKKKNPDNILLGMFNKSREKEELYLFLDPDHYSIHANNKR